MNNLYKIFFVLVFLVFTGVYGIHAQESSRLLFSEEDVPALCLKMETEPFKSMFGVLKNKASETPDGDYDHVYFAANNAFLFTLTGETSYSDSALNSVLYLVNLETWAQDDYRSLGRSMHARGVALAYDMCKKVWPYETDTFISRKLIDMGASLKRSGGSGWPSGPGNNWRAVRYSGMGLCYLAADFIADSSREQEVNYAYDQVVTYFNANLSEEPNAVGWNPEGIGYTIYPAEFWALFNIAAGRMYPGKNFLNENEGTGHTLTTIYRGSILMYATPDLKGYHPDFSDDNMNLNGSGVYGLAFQNVNEDYLPAMKWFYDRLTGDYGDKRYDPDRAGVIYSYLYYPNNIESLNPEEIFGLNYVDPTHGMVIFRNAYKDSTDIIAQHNAKGRAPKHCHGGADANGFRIWGLGGCWTTGAGRIGSLGSPGQTSVLRYDPDEQVPKSSETGNLVYHEFQEDGSGYSVIEGSSTLLPYHRRVFIADYSGLSGLPGLFVISDSTVYGKFWRLNTPEVNEISYHDSSFILTAPNGNRMEGIILHGDKGTIRTGSFARGSGFTWDGETFENNNWLDFESSDRNYLVVLILLEEEQTRPEIKLHKMDDGNYIQVGERVMGISGKEVNFLNKSEWEIILNQKIINLDSDKQVRIFPNPGKSWVGFDFSSFGSNLASAEIYDIKGALVERIQNSQSGKLKKYYQWNSGSNKGLFYLKYFFEDGYCGQSAFVVI
jgi:hypothetical protein